MGNNRDNGNFAVCIGIFILIIIVIAFAFRVSNNKDNELIENYEFVSNRDTSLKILQEETEISEEEITFSIPKKKSERIVREKEGDINDLKGRDKIVLDVIELFSKAIIDGVFEEVNNSKNKRE